MAERHESEHTAAVVERLATLLGGGVVPDTAWQRVAQADALEQAGEAKRRRRAPESTIARLAREVAGGSDAGALLQHHPDATWRALGVTWALATRTGAPLAQSLRQLANGFRDLGQSARDVQVALAGPASASRIVLLLPAVGLVLGAALGFDTIGVLTGSALGFGCLALGGALMLAGWLWNRRLISKATQHPTTPGFGLDLIAMVMLSGRSAEHAMAAVRDALREWGLEGSGFERADGIVHLAAEAGVPAGELLRSEATLERARARADAAQAAAKLGVQLMLPLGACILPAFLAVGVAPLVIAVLQRTIG